MGNAKDIKHMLLFYKILKKNFIEALNYPENKIYEKSCKVSESCRQFVFCVT